MKIQAYKQRARQLEKRYDTSKLKDDKKIQELFKTELKNRFQLLTDMEKVENETIEENGRGFELLALRQVKRYWVLRRKTKKTG